MILTGIANFIAVDSKPNIYKPGETNYILTILGGGKSIDIYIDALAYAKLESFKPFEDIFLTLDLEKREKTTYWKLVDFSKNVKSA